MGTKRRHCPEIPGGRIGFKPSMEFVINGDVVHGKHLRVSRSVYSSKMRLRMSHHNQRQKGGPCIDVCIKCDKDSERECELIRALEHPNVIKCLAVGYESASHTPCLVMGKYRRDMIEAHGEWVEKGMRCADAIRIATGCARAVLHIHERRVFHNDIKPDNFLIYDTHNYENAPVLTDFGMARMCEEGDDCPLYDVRMIIPGGTEDYAPPEATHADSISHGRNGGLGDIWSLGITLKATFRCWLHDVQAWKVLCRALLRMKPGSRMLPGSIVESLEHMVSASRNETERIWHNMVNNWITEMDARRCIGDDMAYRSRLLQHYWRSYLHLWMKAEGPWETSRSRCWFSMLRNWKGHSTSLKKMRLSLQAGHRRLGMKPHWSQMKRNWQQHASLVAPIYHLLRHRYIEEFHCRRHV